MRHRFWEAAIGIHDVGRSSLDVAGKGSGHGENSKGNGKKRKIALTITIGELILGAEFASFREGAASRKYN